MRASVVLRCIQTSNRQLPRFLPHRPFLRVDGSNCVADRFLRGMSTQQSAALPPPAGPGGVRWDLSPAEITAEVAALIQSCTAVLDAVAAVSPAEATFASVIQPLLLLDRDTEARNASVTFIKNVSTSKEVRDASAAAVAQLSAFEVTAGMRIDVYEAVKGWADKAAASGELAAMEPECRRYVERTLRDFKRRGLHLPLPTRRRVEALQTRISDLCVAFQQALAEDDTRLLFTGEQLAGMPAPFVAALTKVPAAAAVGEAAAVVAAVVAGEGAPVPTPTTPTAPENIDAVRATVEAAGGVAAATVAGLEFYEVTMAYPHVVPLLKLAAVSATRAAVERAFNRRGVPANVERLEAIVQLRRYAAHLLGYASHAAFVLEERMARSPAAVAAFLDGLRADLRPLRDADLASLSALKAATEGAGAGPLTMADYRFYMEKELKELYSVDHDAVKQYLPLDVVLPSMLRMYETLLSVRFSEVEASDVHRWHEEARLFEAREGRPGGAEGALLGHIYLDLHPRPGKFTHAAVFPMISGCEAGAPSSTAAAGADGGGGAARVLPLCGMLCNFSRGAAGAPSLLEHSEAVTFYHEFGHVMHHLLSRTRLQRFASFRCEGDFVEAPSQMLENYVWEPKTLALLTGHTDDRSQRLPAALAARLRASKVAHAGLFNTRQVFLATLDQRLHTLPALPPPDSLFEPAAAGAGVAEGTLAVMTTVPLTDAAGARAVDTAALLEELHESVLGLPCTPGTNFTASFGHLVGGYDSGYYGYLWSDVFSADLFESVFKADPLSPAQGARYRDLVLGRGGSVDAADFLREFLGREPNSAAFLAAKGLPAKPLA